MSQLPVLGYVKLVRALQRSGFFVVRQRGSHIRLQKRTQEGTIKLTVPAHRTIKQGTLSHILKAAKLTPEELGKLL